ncbi:MAG: beta propeller repeat protein, partial [Candidatus Dormibacteria bacterium]
MVLAETAPPSGCSQNCEELWASHDGGFSWRRAAATGWSAARFSITVDSRGREIVYSASSSGLQRSVDGGDSWATVGRGGTGATPGPTYGHDAAVAVAG